MCIGLNLLATIGWILGLYDLVTPEVTAISLLLSLAFALGWLPIVLLIIRPMISRVRWLILSFGNILWLVVWSLAWFYFASSYARSFNESASLFAILALPMTVACSFGWLLMIWLATQRLISGGSWRALFLETALCWIGPIVASYVFLWDPLNKMHDMDAWKSPTQAEVRSVSHRLLIWEREPHDSFIGLINCGNESSVPYLLWALRRMPPLNNRACTWDHAHKALRHITNYPLGLTRDEWVEWYAIHSHQSCAEWWADGFTSQGYPVSKSGGDASIRSLFAVLGRTPWCQEEDRPWLFWNAFRILALLDRQDVHRVIDQVLQNGSVQQRCGLARYAKKLDRTKSETVLKQLLQDDQRQVRLCASGTLCQLELEWRKDPQGFIEKRLEPGELGDDAFFSPPGANVVQPTQGSQIDFHETGKLNPHLRLVAVPARMPQQESPICIIRVDLPNAQENFDWWSDPAVVGIEGTSPVTRKTLYSKDILHAIEVHELRWIYDAKTDAVYISFPQFTCKVAPKTGQVLWEMGFGTDNGDDIYVVEDYLIIRCQGKMAICDANRGGILAYYANSPDGLLGSRLTLVDGKLRAKGFKGGLYVLALPQLPPKALPKGEK